jgi:hypothetical protein
MSDELTEFFYVVRTYSGPTRPKVLWKLESRRFRNRQDAEDWKEFCEQGHKNKKHWHEWFVVSRMEKA